MSSPKKKKKEIGFTKKKRSGVKVLTYDTPARQSALKGKR